MDCLPIGPTDIQEDEIDLDKIADITASEGVDVAEDEIGPFEYDYQYEDTSGEITIGGQKDTYKSNIPLNSLDASSETGVKNTSESSNAIRRKRSLRKAPEAPKRFKSAYICYVIEVFEYISLSSHLVNFTLTFFFNDRT